MATTSLRQHHQPLKTLNRGPNFIYTNRSAIIAKRKSAVELLQETKALYVKSETVLDRKQELRSSGHFTHAPSFKYASLHSQAPPPPPKSPRLVAPVTNHRRGPNEQLQNTLRKLFDTNSKENLVDISPVDDENVVPLSTSCHKSLPDLSTQHAIPVITSPPPTKGPELASSSLSCRSQKITPSKSFSLSPVKSCFSDGPLHIVDDSLSISTSHDDAPMSVTSGRSLSQDECDKCLSPIKSAFSYGPVFSSDDREMCNVRPILRSKSDIGDRSLQNVSSPISPVVLPDLEQFFGQLGLESSEYQSLISVRSNTSSPVFFSSSSSLNSSNSDAPSEKTATADSLPRPENAPSIVERNARIIKWLCHCRKVIAPPAPSR